VIISWEDMYLFCNCCSSRLCLVFMVVRMCVSGLIKFAIIIHDLIPCPQIVYT
jgi:hypothetical protein